MRVSDLINLARRYLLLGGVAAVLLLALFLAVYKIVYRKWMHGSRKLHWRNLLWGGVFAMYLVVLLGATFLSRGGSDVYGSMEPLFYSYREAWYRFNAVTIRNLFINILLFVPFGFLLPLGIRRCRVFWKTYLAGFGATLLIELTQLVLRKGVFEWDDVLNNLLGTMIGYGLYALCAFLFCQKGQRRGRLAEAVLCQNPLILCVLIFCFFYATYQKQELGNLAIHYITRIPVAKLSVREDGVYDQAPGRAAVYRVPTYSLDETREIAEGIFAKTGRRLLEDRTDIYDETVFYWAENKNIYIAYRGGTYTYVDNEVNHQENPPAGKTDADREEILRALGALGVQVPEGAVFENEGDGQYSFTADALVTGEKMYDGVLSCTYLESGQITKIYHHILECDSYKEFDLISQADACRLIREGKFQFYAKDRERLEIELGEARLKYVMDSKSFYEPVYSFEAVVNGEEYELQVPAVKR